MNNINIRKIKTIVKIYTISSEGDLNNYAHFFYSVLIPLLEFHIDNIDKNYIYDIFMNCFSFIKILNLLLPDRILNNYDPNIIYSAISYNYDLYNSLNENYQNNIKKNIFFLSTYDIFNDNEFQYVRDKQYIDKIKKNININSKDMWKHIEDKKLNYLRKNIFYSEKIFRAVRILNAGF